MTYIPFQAVAKQIHQAELSCQHKKFKPAGTAQNILSTDSNINYETEEEVTDLPTISVFQYYTGKLHYYWHTGDFF